MACYQVQQRRTVLYTYYVEADSEDEAKGIVAHKNLSPQAIGKHDSDIGGNSYEYIVSMEEMKVEKLKS